MIIFQSWSLPEEEHLDGEASAVAELLLEREEKRAEKPKRKPRVVIPRERGNFTLSLS